MLRNQLTYPQSRIISPSLRVKIEHDLVWEFPLFTCKNDIMCRFKRIIIGKRLLPSHKRIYTAVCRPITHTNLISVPATSRIGKIEHLTEIQVKVRFSDDTVIPMIIMVPDGAVVVFAERAAMHADGFNLGDLTKLHKMGFK